MCCTCDGGWWAWRYHGEHNEKDWLGAWLGLDLAWHEDDVDAHGNEVWLRYKAYEVEN